MDAQDKLEEVALAAVSTAFPWPDMQVIERAGWYQTITPSSGTVLGNEVVLSQIDGASAEDVVRRTIGAYAAHGVPFRWAVTPLTRPAGFGELLERHGFAGHAVRGMAIDPAAWAAAPPAAAGVAIDPVTRDNIDDYIDAFERGWDFRIAREQYRRGMHGALDLGYQMFIARVGGEPAATGGFIVKPRSGYLVGGNVLPAFRGRGIYRALVGERLRRMRELGIALATTQAREATSAPILERFGFESVFRSNIYRLDDTRAAAARAELTGTAGPG